MVVGLATNDRVPGLGADLLIGTVGARIMNMIMTLATFARLCAVSTTVRTTAYDTGAWEGLTLHLHRLWQPARHYIFDRLLQTWRRLNVLYLNYTEANNLGDRRPCPVVGVWNFHRRVPGSRLNSTRLPHVFCSYDVVQSGVKIDFNVRFRGRMPAFEVGWATTWDLDYLLDDINSGNPLHSYVRFRVTSADSLLAAQADRGRWFNYNRMGDDAAVRLPWYWMQGLSDAVVCLRIGLVFTETYMNVYFNGNRWSAKVETQFSREWTRHLTRHVILVISNEPTFRHLTLEPIPARFS